jgi:hypothetical protein
MKMLNRHARLTLTAFVLSIFCCASSVAQTTVRREIADSLRAAQELIKGEKFKEALNRLNQLDTVTNKNDEEIYFFERLRANAATGSGDEKAAIQAHEALLKSKRLLPAERLQSLEAITVSALRSKDSATAIDAAQRYFTADGSAPNMKRLQLRAHYMGADFAGVTRLVQAAGAGLRDSTIDEPSLSLIAASYVKLGDEVGYTTTLEILLERYPKKAYWADRLARLQNHPNFSAKLGLELYRLQFVTDTMESAEQYIEMAQLALQAGFPGDAKNILESGFNSAKLGTGEQAASHRKMRESAIKQLAEDTKALAGSADVQSAEGLLNTGLALASVGQTQKGIALIEQALATGRIKRVEEAKLQLGQRLLQANNRQRAIEVFKSVGGSDGTLDLARLWIIFASKV